MGSQERDLLEIKGIPQNREINYKIFFSLFFQFILILFILKLNKNDNSLKNRSCSLTEDRKNLKSVSSLVFMPNAGHCPFNVCLL